VERVIEQELQTLKTLTNEIEKDFHNLLETLAEPETQYIKMKIKKHLNTLQTLISDLRTDLEWIEEWRCDK
jgi:hypothetical protein